MTTGASGSWVLCGLVRADRFRSESQLIPYSYILAMLAVILLAAASYPYVRLSLSLPGERLRARDVAITAVFTCFIAAVVTFILTDIYFWNSVFGPGADGEMAKFARAINANFQLEPAIAVSAGRLRFSPGSDVAESCGMILGRRQWAPGESEYPVVRDSSVKISVP